MCTGRKCKLTDMRIRSPNGFKSAMFLVDSRPITSSSCGMHQGSDLHAMTADVPATPSYAPISPSHITWKGRPDRSKSICPDLP